VHFYTEDLALAFFVRIRDERRCYGKQTMRSCDIWITAAF